MSSTSNSDDSFEELFNWNKYLSLRNSEEVPEIFFSHICSSEQNGIELGSVIEVENEDQDGYWFASVFSSNGVLINLHYVGDENNTHNFWLEVKSSRIHPLNWGSENNKKLVPPYPDRFLRVNPEVVKEKVQYCENVVPDSVLRLNGAPIYNIFKPGMFVEVQDKEYPYRVWISKVLKNVGGRLFLKMQGVSCPEEKPFWLFYSNDRIFPLGWAEQKGLPWRVMNVDVNIEEPNDSSLLLNVLKPKTPAQHSYKVGDMLEAINPYSLMVFYVATIVKIYDNRYFKVEVNNDSDTDKRITFVATKENPYLFNTGWACKHKFLLKPPADWDSPNKFCWLTYATMKNSKLAQVEYACRKKFDNIHIGMKLEAVDPVNPDHIRVATVKGFADHWIILSFDRTNWCQELLHVRSIYSDDIFPIGWCNKHKYSLSIPKLPFTDCNNYESNYYASDIDMDNESHEDILTKYPHYFKGEIPYHFSQKNDRTFEDDLEESIQNILNESLNSPSDLKSEDNNDTEPIIDITEPIINITEPIINITEPIIDITEPIINNIEPIINVKEEQTELDEEFHDALFLEEEVDAVQNNNDHAKTKLKIKYHKKVKRQKKEFNKNRYKTSIYFNKKCYTNNRFIKKKLNKLPNYIGPGPVHKILKEALTLFIKLDYVPISMLKKIKKNQNILFNGPGGVETIINTKNMKTRTKCFEYLLLPGTKELAEIYCKTLCRLTGICKFFISTEKTECSHCLVSENKKLKYLTKIPPTIVETTKIKTEYDVNSSIKLESETINEKIARAAVGQLDWSNKPLVERYKFYMACIKNYEAYIKKLGQSPTQVELALLAEIEMKKVHLRIMDDIDIFSNTKSDLDKLKKKQFGFINDWKTTFERFYRQSPVYKHCKIHVGHFKHIKVTSNPNEWSPDAVYKYLSNDVYCKDIKKVLLEGQVDGKAFMLLNEEQLVYRLRYSINLAIRVMCHVAHVKHVWLTEYKNDCDSHSKYEY